MPALTRMGRVVLGDIGVPVDGRWSEIGTPCLPALDPARHKYDRGMVAVVAGAMPGAAALAATAAARAGAGYVKLIADERVSGLPSAVVQGQGGTLDDPRIGALLIGPGLGISGARLLGQALHVSASERKILLACGAAAGMAATFGAPLAAVVLAIELLLFEFSTRAFVPLVVATSIAGAVHAATFWRSWAGSILSSVSLAVWCRSK